MGAHSDFGSRRSMLPGPKAEGRMRKTSVLQNVWTERETQELCFQSETQETF